jgi:dTDP-4-amino-4,6-dideoxygalactose transaminase
MGLQQLDKLEMLDSARRVNWEKMKQIFAPYERFFHIPEATEKSDPCWFAFLLTVKEGAPFSRSDIVEHLESFKIQTRSYFSGNILAHPGYIHMAEEYGDMNVTFPNAQLVTTNSFFLGTYAGLTDEKIQYIKEAVDGFLGDFE